MAFTVDLPRLLALIDQMEQFDQKAAAVCDEVEQAIAGLHATWDGTAAEQQRQAHDLWVQGTDAMTEALRQLRTDAATAHRNYDRAFAAGEAMWSEP